MADIMGKVSGMVGGGGGISGVLIGNLGKMALTVAVIVVISIGCFILLWFMKFKTNVVIYNERADGSVFRTKTKGGFFKNPISKIESFKILKDPRSIIKPMPNKLIETKSKSFNLISKTINPVRINLDTLKREYIGSKDGKDIIYFRKTAYDEYIPMTIKEELIFIDEKTGVERKSFTVYPEFIKGWLSIKHTEIRSKYGITSFLDKYGVIISFGIIVLIWFIVLDC